MTKLVAVLFAIASSLFLAPAHSALVNIDFEGVVPNGEFGSCPSTPYAEDSFTLTSSPEGDCNNFISNNAPGNDIFGNTTSVLGFCQGCITGFTLTGPVFSVLSIDLGGHFGSDPGELLFTGNFSGGGTITQIIDAGIFWGTYALSGFTALSSLNIEFSSPGTDGHASMDNISISVLPEPASLALLGLGLIGLLGFSRRKTA